MQAVLQRDRGRDVIIHGFLSHTLKSRFHDHLENESGEIFFFCKYVMSICMSIKHKKIEYVLNCMKKIEIC